VTTSTAVATTTSTIPSADLCPGSDFDGILCLLASLETPDVCAGVDLPRAIVRRLRRAGQLVAHAKSSQHGARGKLRRATTMMRGTAVRVGRLADTHAMDATCVALVVDRLGEATVRAEALSAHP
jgi:hypothetical protein